MRFTKILAASAIAVAAIALSACSSSAPADSSSTPIGGDIVAPVSMQANDLQGATVDLIVGQVLNINTGDLAVDSYEGVVADESVARFVPGDAGQSAELNPGVEALAVGETTVTMTNENGGIQPLEFTVVVSEK